MIASQQRNKSECSRKARGKFSMARQFVCIKDFENCASNNLTPAVRNFFNNGAGDEDTLKWNRSAFKKLRIRSRVLRDVSKRDISTTVLGEKVSMPLGIAPSSMQKSAHPDGECASVKAAEAAKTVFILSTLSTTSVEEVAQVAPQAVKWLQVYVFRDRNVTLNLIRRAEKAGFKALVLTVDTPVFGDRRQTMRDNFTMPGHLKFANFDGHLSKDTNLQDYIQSQFDDSLSWDDVDWLRSISKLPVVLKGILSAEDAVIAVEHGASAVLVSNHGARQIDGVPATIEALPEIVSAVGNKIDVYMDGGITQGTDVFKALALGAKMVFFGRPLLWGLSCGGEQGARAVLEIMRREINQAFALAGCLSVKEVTRNMVAHESVYSRL